MADDQGSPCFENCVFAIIPSKDIPSFRVAEVCFFLTLRPSVQQLAKYILI